MSRAEGKRLHRWPTAPERFGTRISEVPSPEGVEGPCWQWDVLRPATGYGDFHDIKPWLAHRWSYTHHIGQIPEGLELDHLCRNRGCVNPWRLEPVTSQVNSARGYWGMKTECLNGHEYTPENTRRFNGKRCCVTCKRESDRRYRQARTGAA